ncbi:hypothetical protein OQA88_2804 [Cercophora sp. LCS_1]
MAPNKSSRNGNGQDDPKPETPSAKEKNGTSNTHQGNGKLRRVASSTGSNLREVTNSSAGAAAAPTPTAAAPPGGGQELVNPGLQWPAFDREVLHAYRRAYRLNTPTAFKSEYHQWVLTQAGSVGIYSPTIARRKELRRQNSSQLTNAVRKHFNGLGVQENDVIVDFLHKTRSQGVSKGKPKRLEHVPTD